MRKLKETYDAILQIGDETFYIRNTYDVDTSTEAVDIYDENEEFLQEYWGLNVTNDPDDNNLQTIKDFIAETYL